MPDPPCPPPASMSTHLAFHSVRAMDRVLSITEILRLVFRFLSLGCNTKNARVCKKWCDIALDNIWIEITDVTCLFNLLAPLSGHGKHQKFSRLPGQQNWARFKTYGRRIRVLHFKEDEESEMTGFKDVFDILGKHRPTLRILPNLHTLMWTTGSIQSVMQDSILFMHNNVENFTITIPVATKYDDLTHFFGIVVARMPGLSNLVLQSHVPLSDIENHIIELLLGLPELNHIILPNCHLPSRIAEGLSRMDHLETLKINASDEWAFRSEKGTEIFAPCLAEGAFPSLRTLCLRANLEEASQFMNSSFAPHAITEICITSCSPSPEASFAVEAFLSVLARTCPDLQDVNLTCLISVTILSEPPSPNHIITYGALRPIFRPVLRGFEISHPYPLHVTLDDVDDIARQCPLLNRIILNCDPAILKSDRQLPLTALASFARHCPRMTILGLFFGAATSNLSLSRVEDLKPFEKPVVLTVGTSDIDENVGPTIQFLSQICSLGCEIEVVVEWPGTFGEVRRSISGVEELLQLRRTRWRQVGCLMPVLEELRIKDKENMRNLEAKVKALGKQVDQATQKT